MPAGHYRRDSIPTRAQRQTVRSDRSALGRHAREPHRKHSDWQGQGRSVLYSIRQASMARRAWAIVRNQCSFRHSSRKRPLKPKPLTVNRSWSITDEVAFDVGVLDGLSWTDIAQSYAGLVRPCIKHLAFELRSMIHGDRQRQPTHVCQALEHCGDAPPRERQQPTQKRPFSKPPVDRRRSSGQMGRAEAID